MAVLENDVFKQTFIEYLEYKEQFQIAELMKTCDFTVTDTGNFTYVIWNQTGIEIDIRVPLSIMKQVDEKWDSIDKMCYEVYPRDEDHALRKVIKELGHQHPVKVFQKVVQLLLEGRYTIT
ncbi:hypothetical protein [Fictibacillus sp. JL2B1089]|uniref:hypothetical protein n=1 Tax=Fictibacillus sp. JL2B1089 TaxID=3399565 RepID=UPI003A8AEF12